MKQLRKRLGHDHDHATNLSGGRTRSVTSVGNAMESRCGRKSTRTEYTTTHDHGVEVRRHVRETRRGSLAPWEIGIQPRSPAARDDH